MIHLFQIKFAYRYTARPSPLQTQISMAARNKDGCQTTRYGPVVANGRSILSLDDRTFSRLFANQRGDYDRA